VHFKAEERYLAEYRADKQKVRQAISREFLQRSNEAALIRRRRRHKYERKANDFSPMPLSWARNRVGWLSYRVRIFLHYSACAMIPDDGSASRFRPKNLYNCEAGMWDFGIRPLENLSEARVSGSKDCMLMEKGAPQTQGKAL